MDWNQSLTLMVPCEARALRGGGHQALRERDFREKMTLHLGRVGRSARAEFLNLVLSWVGLYRIFHCFMYYFCWSIFLIYFLCMYIYNYIYIYIYIYMGCV